MIAIIIVISFLSYKGITQAYLLYIANNEKQTLLLKLFINCISARSVPQIMSQKDECTFWFSNFLIIGLCKPSANIVLFSITQLKVLAPQVLL